MATVPSDLLRIACLGKLLEINVDMILLFLQSSLPLPVIVTEDVDGEEKFRGKNMAHQDSGARPRAGNLPSISICRVLSLISHF